MVDDSAETSQNIISTDGSKLLVLLAEDETLIQVTLEDVVTEAGLEHFSVSSADEAIRALEEDSARRSTHRCPQSIVGRPLDRVDRSAIAVVASAFASECSLKAGGLPPRVFSVGKSIRFSRTGRLTPLAGRPLRIL